MDHPNLKFAGHTVQSFKYLVSGWIVNNIFNNPIKANAYIEKARYHVNEMERIMISEKKK